MPHEALVSTMSDVPVNVGHGWRPRVPWLQLTALLIGLWYLALGIAGFVTHGTTIGPDDSRTVWGFANSALLNFWHTLIGLLGVFGAYREGTTRVFGVLTFVGFAGLTAYSILATVLTDQADLANVAASNTWLYGFTALAGLLLAFLPVRQEDPRRRR